MVIRIMTTLAECQAIHPLLYTQNLLYVYLL